jgi:hypothetical protein
MFGTDFADVDNDGDLDTGSISFGCCAGVHVYLNQGDGTWVQSFGFWTQLGRDVFGDINGDGNADLAVSQYGTIYLGDGAWIRARRREPAGRRLLGAARRLTR